MAPQRIQLRRTKGWRMPPGAVKVDRTTRWGNPYVIHEHSDHECGPDLLDCPLDSGERTAESREDAVRRFRWLFTAPTNSDPEYPSEDEIRWHLAGRDLACWCPLSEPCHADVLLAIANPTTTEAQP